MRLQAWMLVIAGTVALAACGDGDAIRHYRVPKETPAPVSTPPGPTGDRQLLGAILPRPDKTWFFKLEGPGPQVRAERGRFEAFIASISFGSAEGATLPAWTLPEGWTVKPGSGMRAATIRIAGATTSLEMSVVTLGREGQAASVPANVNRWRDQLGLAPLDEARMGEVTRAVRTAEGSEATLVNLSTGGAVSDAPTPEATPGPPPLQFKAPAGWVALPPKGMRVAAFHIADDDLEGEVTIVPLGGAAGSLLANVNRWRGQVGLDPVQEKELDASTAKVKVNGEPATYLDFSGPKGRILAVILVRGAKTWFFKAQGPAPLLEKQRAAFDEFVRSVRFES